MRAALLAILFTNLAAAPAYADDASDINYTLDKLLSAETFPGTKLPQLSIMFGSVDDKPGDWGGLFYGNGAPTGAPKDAVIGVSTDGTAAWIASDVVFTPCIRGAVPGDTSGDSSYNEGERCKWEQKGAFARWAVLFERDAKVWQPIVWHLYGFARGFVGPARYDKLASSASPTAAPALAVFTASLAEPKAMTATLSPRKDTALFGSALGERYVGAAAIGAALAKWNLALATVDGIRAGTAGKSVAWVAANLQATSRANKKKKPAYYRVVFVYEHTGDKWQLVQATFSDENAPGAPRP